MALAYVLLVVRAGSEKAVVKRLLEHSQVEDANIIFGEYDIIVKINEKNNNLLQSFVIDQIRSMPDVEQTSTLISADPE